MNSLCRGALGAALVLMLAGAGCKGKTVEKDSPETLNTLKMCEANLQEKVAYINTLNERITELESAGTGASTDDAVVVVNIEGEAMVVTSGKGPNGRTGDATGNAKDTELYEAFVAQLKRSRGAIKKCYQAALKKNSALSAKSITLKIGVDYKTSGQVKAAHFSPTVSDQFEKCMDGVASNWTLPAMPRSVTFNYNQTLTPE